MVRGLRYTLLIAAGAVALYGCGSDGPTTSTFRGKISEASFGTKIGKITAKASNGATTVVAVAQDGTFALPLRKGEKYEIFVGQDIPLVLRTSDLGKLETDVSLSGGGAMVDLGLVRFWAGAPVTLKSQQRGVATEPPISGIDTTLACVDGVYAGSVMPCASSGAPISCQSAGDDDDDECEQEGENEGQCGGDDDDEEEGDDDDGEEAEGDDDDGDDAGSDVDSGDAVAVAQFSVPNSIACGGDDDDDEDDDDEEEEDDDDD